MQYFVHICLRFSLYEYFHVKSSQLWVNNEEGDVFEVVGSSSCFVMWHRWRHFVRVGAEVWRGPEAVALKLSDRTHFQQDREKKEGKKREERVIATLLMWAGARAGRYLTEVDLKNRGLLC